MDWRTFELHICTLEIALMDWHETWITNLPFADCTDVLTRNVNHKSALTDEQEL